MLVCISGTLPRVPNFSPLIYSLDLTRFMVVHLLRARQVIKYTKEVPHIVTVDKTEKIPVPVKRTLRKDIHHFDVLEPKYGTLRSVRFTTRDTLRFFMKFSSDLYWG